MDGVTNNSRQEIEAAIAKAVELRALHASLMQGNTPPPFPPPLSHFSAHDYPVFSPSYVDEPLPGYAHLQTATQIIGENWEENQTNLHDKTLQLSNYTRPNVLSRKELPSGIVSLDNHILLTDDTKSVTSWCTDQMSFMQNSPGNEILKSRRRNNLEDNNCKPATINTDNDEESIKHSKDIVVPLTESRAAMNPSQLKPRGVVLSWLLPRFKRKQKNNSSPGRAESEVSHGLQDFGAKPTEVLMKELVEAKQKRDLAFAEVSEMRSSFGELRKKLESLKSYCEELKKGLQHSKRGKLSHDKNGDKLMPVSEEDMIEGFLQIVSEARLSVKQFCKTLLDQIDETDVQLIENLNLLLTPYKLSLSSRYSKVVFYHLEAMINQGFYQDFENCMFQESGAPKFLDPNQNQQAKFQSFTELRNLSWNKVLKKGAKYYSEELSQFCDQKMSCIITRLNWTRSWSDTLLQSFFVAAKCIWLLHLLSFSFYPPLMILRVNENRWFDSHYMEDIFSDKQKMQNPRRVKVMIMPGFYVQDKILKCKVLCTYKSVA